MAVSLKTSGSWVEATADATPTLVGTPAAGDRYFIFATWKDFSITCTVDASSGNWVEVTEFADGSVGNGNGLGSMKVGCWYRDWVSGDVNPTINFSASPNEAAYCMQLWQKGGSEDWHNLRFVTAAWPSSSAQTVNASSTVDVDSSSVVLCLIGIRDDSAAFTRTTTSISDSGGLVTWNGNFVESPATHATYTTGSDCAADLGHRFVTTGASGVTLRAEATISAAETGAILWVMQSVIADSGAVTVTPSGGSLTLTGSAPILDLGVRPSAGSLTLTGSAPTVLNPTALIATLTDSFATQDTNKWAYISGVAASGGQLVFTPPVSSQVLLPSVNTFDATDSAIFIETTTVGTDFFGFGFWNADNNTDSIEFYCVPSGDLTFAEYVNGTPDSTTLTYNATNHRWLRITNTGGNWLWETSPDGTTWTTRRTKAKAAGFTITSVEAYVYVDSGNPASTTRFDNVNNVNLVPSGGSLALTGSAPTVTIGGGGGTTVTPSGASLTVSGSAPPLDFGIRPAGASSTVTGSAPVLDSGIFPSGGSLTLTGSAPTVTIGVNVTPDAASLALTGSAPTIVLPQLVTPAGATLTLTGSAPPLDTGLRPAAATAALTGSAPILDTGVQPAAAAATLTGAAPSLDFSIRPSGGSLTLTGFAPSLGGPQNFTPAGASLTLTGSAPSLDTGLWPGGASTTITGAAPVLDSGVRPAGVTAALTGHAPTITVGGPQVITPAGATLTLTGGVPMLAGRDVIIALNGLHNSLIGLAAVKPGTVALAGRRDSTNTLAGVRPNLALALAGTRRTTVDL